MGFEQWVSWFAYKRHAQGETSAICRNYLFRGGAVFPWSLALQVAQHQEYRKCGNRVNRPIPILGSASQISLSCTFLSPAATGHHHLEASGHFRINLRKLSTSLSPNLTLLFSPAQETLPPKIKLETWVTPFFSLLPLLSPSAVPFSSFSRVYLTFTTSPWSLCYHVTLNQCLLSDLPTSSLRCVGKIQQTTNQ